MTTTYAKDATTGRHPGSMTKVVTALVAQDAIAPAEWASTLITVQGSDMAANPEESVMGLQVGDVVSFLDLLYGLMPPSGNDAARAIARHAGEIIRGSPGSSAEYLAAFVGAMNAKASAIGMTASNFLDSWGVTAGTRMSPADAAAAMWELSESEPLLEIVAAESRAVAVNGPNARTINLTHTFSRDGLVEFPEVIACKTGYAWSGSENSGRCCVALWETPSGARRVSVVMGGETSLRRYQDLRSMIDCELARMGQL